MADKYRAKVDLWYPTDAKVIARLKRGERVPDDELKQKHVKAGQIVDDVPAVSVPWLLSDSLIERVKD